MRKRKRPAMQLDLSARRAPGVGRACAFRRAEADPLTGHRGGGEGEALVAELGPATLLARLTRDARGLVLRGQVIAAPGTPALTLHGALLHARGQGSAAMAAASDDGEFAVRGWEGALTAIDLELEEGAWRIAWPAPEEAT